MKRWAALCGLAIFLIVILADTRRLEVIGAFYDFPNGDKVGHFLLFGLFSLLVNLAVFEARPLVGTVRLAWRTSLLLALLIAAEEMSQRWIASRTSSVTDLAASWLGVTIFACVAVVI
ncbi:MAG: VanZ family protein [Anaerolineales bacterium]